tara:strand:+ start:43146 stop:43763 length:618 start_codon:yes stop_codon:yes gene_type:complete
MHLEIVSPTPKSETKLSSKRGRKAKARLTADDWIRVAGTVLAQEGIAAVRVEPLAAKLGVTKGSFYHHFPDRPALHRAILDDWRRRATKGIISRLNENVTDARTRLMGVFSLPSRGQRAAEGANLELAIRLWAKNDNEAKRILQEVDEQRLDYIASLFEKMGLDQRNARARAFILYASTMGHAMFSLDDLDTDLETITSQLLDGF